MGQCVRGFALPGFDPFSNAAGLAANGTSYPNDSPLYHQTNAFGEGWALWNGGSGSASAEVKCVTNTLAYGGFPAGFPAPSPTNAVLIPGMDQGVNAYGYSAALMFSRLVATDTNNLVTNKIYASFLLQVPGIGNLATSGTKPIYFGGFNNSTVGDQNTMVPGQSFKLFLEGNSSTAGASTQWALGIADNSGGATERFDPSFRTTSTVLFVVVDYEFGINGGNDNARLWINPAGSSFGAAVAPAPTTNITITAASGNELGQAANFFLFCRSGATLWGSILISDLRIGTTWGFVTGGPEFASQPVSQSAAAGATVTLQAVAVAGGSAVAYQWKQGGTSLTNGGIVSGATTSTLTLTGITAASAGSYSVMASNSLGSVSSSIATLTITAADPRIVSPPQNLTTNYLGTASFSVLAGGTAPFAYRWLFNGSPMVDGVLADGATVSGSITSNLTVAGVTYLEAGSYSVAVSNTHGAVTSAPAALTVLAPLAITSAPQSRVERVGDNLAFIAGLNGPASYQWQWNGSPIPGATNARLVLTNIQTTNAGTYTIVASNVTMTASASATLTVSTGWLHLSPTNLVVARVGDGAQPLNTSNGNTLYLDQFTTAGDYVSTIMVPDRGPQALIEPGAGDGIYESVLTLSDNRQFLNFGGYNVTRPYQGADVTAGNVTVRGIAAVNGLGYYTLVLTNIGLYSGGNHFLRSVASTDGLTNFWTTGAASTAGIKYIAPGLYANGQGIPALGGGFSGTRVAGIFQGAVVFSDAEGNLTQTGINSFDGLPTGTASTTLLFPVGTAASPTDFAISPDGNTVYLADDRAVNGNVGGGIQRWDFDQVQWTLSYTLGTGSNSTVGARGLAVDFTQFTGDGATGSGAVIYATTAEPSANRLISIADSGAGLAAAVLATAGPNQLLRGVRFGPTAAPVFVDSPPQNQNAEVGANVSFAVSISGSQPIYYQWQFNGTNLAGATQSTLNLTSISPASAGAYSVIVSNDISVADVLAFLEVMIDTKPPVILGVGTLGLTQVEVMLSTEISATTATNAANYSIGGTNGPVTVLSAAQDASQSNVVLTVSALANGATYTLSVSSLANTFAPASVIAPDTQTTFVASTYVPVGIGLDPPPLQTVLSNGYLITSTGLEINGNSDQAAFSGQLQSGDFDLSVCLAGLGAADVWSEAGLMARQSLAQGSPFAAALATPGMSGCFFDARAATNAASSVTGIFPANFPNTWLRLSRVGSVFTGYASYDGQNWTPLGTTGITMTDPIYVGLAVTSNNTNTPTTAQFLNPGPTPPNAVVVANSNPHEPLGPCSRKTGIVVSEIMYKPAARADTNNCEFVEIYNSQPYFHDISGYQITCADMNYRFPANTIIPAGGFLVMAASSQSIQAVYGITNVMGPYTGSLKKSETLQLLDEQTNVLLTVPYADNYPWPVAAEGTGHSIVLANPSYGEGDPRAWDISDVVGGSPGAMKCYRPNPLRNVLINEILPHSENPAVPQFVELYNHSTQSVDVSSCILTDDPSTNRFVIPPGTVISPAGFVSFNQSQLGFALNGAGETLYFIKPDGSRVLDAVQFTAQADGVSFGRWPDGANDFYALQARTPGTNNSAIRIGDIVLNELMYDPISGDDDAQYVELYNKGTNTVSLANWQFTAGVAFTFPANATLAPNGYLVVARNVTNLLSLYTNLTTGNTVGNYSGKLSHNGERVALAMPQSFYGTNTIYVVEDEVTYSTGGRWGQWSSGGGSSLELIDPRANHRLAANWADSDDTGKSQWVTISNTGVLDNGTNYASGIQFAQVGLLDVGECLVDNVQALWQGTNYATNSTFESGLAGWSFQGDHIRSSLESSGYQSGSSLHVRCSDKYWQGDNSCQVALTANAMAAGNTVTLQYQARWLHGWPEPVLRLNGGWLEATAAMPVPANLGTPGMPNSAYATNTGPAIYQVTHTPSVPAAGQAFVVTARVHDPDGVQSFTLYYRIDPSTSYTAVPMLDNGGGDAIAADGVFSATIPGQAANVMAAFYLAATDNLGATTRFPALRPANNEPVRECVVLFGDGNPVSSFGVYHLWLTQTNLQRWINLSDLGNEYMDATFVNNTRVIYGAGTRYTGSPSHQNYKSPIGTKSSYEWVFPDDDQFLGTKSFHKIHYPGNGGNDPSLQREQTSYTFMRALGLPWLFRRNVAVYINGNRNGPLMEDSQLPNGDMVKEYFPSDSDGFLYKWDQWFEFAGAPSGQSIAYKKECTFTLLPYTTTGGVKKVARYRPIFELRRTPDSMNNFTNVFSLVDAASSYGTAGYVANMENLANMENWMEVFAVNHAVGNWDVFGGQTGQNLYGYIGGLGTKFTLMMWDMNIDLGTGWGPGQNLFISNVNDPNTENIFNCPTFRRMYWRALEALVNGPLNPANTAPLCNAKYNAFVADGLSVENPATGFLPWIGQAQTSIAAQLAAVDAPAFSVNPNVSVTNNVAYFSGVAPVLVNAVWFNGQAWPVTWTTLTSWTAAVPLQPGTNQFQIVGADIHGQPVSGAANLAVAYDGSAPSPAGQVVINEIMYNPGVPGAQFVELFNSSSNLTFDLSGWQFQGLNYTFPPGSTITPNGFLVLAANGAAFAAAYGATIPVFDTFGQGVLKTNGATLLALTQPDASVVAEVQYGSALPWPAGANGQGASLQLIDPRQDNWRAGNWSAAPPTPAVINSTRASLPAFPSLWINEVEPHNVNGLTNRAGQRTPWLEVYNPTTNVVSCNGLFLSSTYANLTNWAFPAGAVINPGQFAVVFADGQTALSDLSELHTSFTLPPASGSVALSRLYNNQPQVLDFVDYANLPANYSYGSFPDGQSFNRQVFSYATPGGTNNGTLSYAVGYNALGALYTQNFDSLPNPGTTTVNTANPVTINGVTYSLDNPLNFAAPVSVTSAGGLGLADTLSGWFGLAGVAMKAGANSGDQSTGGIISFGPTSDAATNRALGLLATSSTGPTAFGVKLINGTTNTIDEMTLSYTGELWRQQPSPKTLAFSYLVVPTGTNSFSTNGGTVLPGLNVTFPTGVFSPVDGTQSANQVYLSVTNQPISDWPPGAALWLIWQMADATGNSQGLAIDNLAFSANSTYSTGLPLPPFIVTQPASQTVPTGATVTLSVNAGGSAPLSYQWFWNNTRLSDGGAFTGSTTSTLTIANVSSAQIGSYLVTVSNTAGTAMSQTAIIGLIGPSYIAYTDAGAVYAQNFDALPNPGTTTVNTANPVSINGVTYALPNPFDFAYPVSAIGGLGLANSMPGWYGWGGTAVKFGASAGDQTTGGVISFGPTTSASTNRALGLLATSTTGPTAFAARILNQTGKVLTNMNLAFTGELWRQQTSAKTLSFSYYIDPTGTNSFSVNNITATLPSLGVSFPTGASASGSAGPIMTAALNVTNQVISNCPPGAALWLVWEMASAAGSSQGFGIDNFTFSANGFTPPSLSVTRINSSVILAWPVSASGYTLQYNSSGLSQSSAWFTAGLPVVVSNQFNTVTVPVTNHLQFYRLEQ